MHKHHHHWSRQAIRFVLVGLSATCVDWTLYRTFLWLTSIIPLSKAMSFIIATTYTYNMNRLWTFGGHSQKELNHFARFISLYLTTLGLNVMINSYLLHLLSSYDLRLVFAFIGATTVSAALNFVGMKFYVFPSKNIP